MQQSEADLELEAPQSSPVKPFAAKLDNALLQGTAKSGDRPIRQHTEAHPELKAVLGQSVSSSNKVLASYRPLFQSCQCIHSPEFRMQSLKSFANERSHPARGPNQLLTALLCSCMATTNCTAHAWDISTLNRSICAYFQDNNCGFVCRLR